MAVAREEAGLDALEEYTRRSQNMVAQFIDMRSLLDLCEETERAPGEQVGIKLWEQAGIDLKGYRENAAAEVDEDGREQ